jgi:hypothetical protein
MVPPAPPVPVALGLAEAPNLTTTYPYLRDTITGRPAGSQ